MGQEHGGRCARPLGHISILGKSEHPHTQQYGGGIPARAVFFLTREKIDRTDLDPEILEKEVLRHHSQ